MTRFILKRLLLLPLLLLLIVFSITVLAIVQAPPGDFLTTYVANAGLLGQLDHRRAGRGPAHRIRPRSADLGPVPQVDAESRPGRPRLSLEYQRPNAELIGERFALTVALTLFAFVFTWAVAIPAGIYSATHPRSALDYVFTVLNYVGVATPNFMLALVLMWGAFAYFGVSVTGLFSPEFVEAPWSGRRVLDLLAHIWLAAVVLGVAGTARLMGVMRANLLDELHKPYVTTARAKGLSEWRLVWRYPVRLALNPLVSTIGGYLRLLFAGSLIVATIRIWVDNLWEFGTIGRTPMVQGVVRRQLALPQRPDHARQRLAPAQPRQRAPGAVLLRPVGRRALRSCRAGVSRARRRRRPPGEPGGRRRRRASPRIRRRNGPPTR